MFVGMLVFMSLLSITHFKQYMKLHLFRLANAVELEDEDVSSPATHRCLWSTDLL